MSDAKILLADDDEELCQLLADFLVREGFAVDLAHDGETTLRMAAEGGYDALILDVMLPHRSGLDVLRELRRNSQLPVLMLTALGEDIDRIVGLELGADDYLPKPFAPRELLARLRAILRRRGNGTSSEAPLCFGRLEIDRAARTLRIDGAERMITSYQFALLVALAENAGRVLSRDTLMDLVKGEALEAFDRSIDVHVSRIRAAIEDDAKHPRRIITVRGAGYVFAKEQDR